MSILANLIAGAVEAPAYFSKESKKNSTVTLVVTATTIRQTRDIATNKPESWDDGTPKQQIVIVGASTNDGAHYTIYVKWWGAQRKAFAAAFTESETGEPMSGGMLTATYVGEGAKADPKLDAPKLFEYSYTDPGEVEYAQPEAAE